MARRDDRITKPTDNRVPHMERIISHFLGDVSQDASHLKRIAEKLTQRPGPCVSSEELDDLAIGEEQFTVKSISSKTARKSYQSFASEHPNDCRLFRRVLALELLPKDQKKDRRAFWTGK